MVKVGTTKFFKEGVDSLKLLGDNAQWSIFRGNLADKRRRIWNPNGGGCIGSIKSSAAGVTHLICGIRKFSNCPPESGRLGDGYSLTKKVYNRYYEWLMNESPWSDAFESKDIVKGERGKRDGLIMDTSQPSNLVAAGMIAARMTWEYPEYCRLWYELCSQGIDPMIAYYIINSFNLWNGGTQIANKRGLKYTKYVPKNTGDYKETYCCYHKGTDLWYLKQLVVGKINNPTSYSFYESCRYITRAPVYKANNKEPGSWSGIVNAVCGAPAQHLTSNSLKEYGLPTRSKATNEYFNVRDHYTKKLMSPVTGTYKDSWGDEYPKYKGESIKEILDRVVSVSFELQDVVYKMIEQYGETPRCKLWAKRKDVACAA